MGGRGTLPYRDGYLELTDSHLFVVCDGYLAESLALRHLSDVTLEEAHSFRHRIWGVVAAVALFAPAALALIPEDLAGGLALLAMFRGKVLIAVIFCFFFGLLILWGVVTSQRTSWVRLRYGGGAKLIPLPGVEPHIVEQFVQVVSDAVEDRAKG